MAQAATRRGNVYGVIVCQGDSLTFGSRDPDGMSYPLYLGRLLSQKHRQTWVTVNFGVPGECWSDVWRRNYRELLSVPDAWKGRAFEESVTACEAVLDQCRAAGRHVYLANLPGKQGFGAPREPWSMNDMVKKLNDAYVRIAEERGLTLVNLADLPAEHFCDGIHITQDGNRWVAERFAAAIEARR